MKEKKLKKDFDFSIIMAVYNVEDFLEEAIESVLNQTLNFEKHVELILVNDGSSDNSREICIRYKEKYDNNIVYIEKTNGGVSSARNRGIEAASGKYINFMDPDDKLSVNTLEEVLKFYNSKGNDLDLVSIPIYWFDQAKGKHVLNHKFTYNRIINIFNEHKSIQMSSSTSFIRKDSIGDLRFNEGLKYGEDADFVNRIILKKCEYGVLSNVVYWYRKRKTPTSATHRMLDDKDYYLYSVQNFSLNLINHTRELIGFVPSYIQYVIMYDLQWRFNNNSLKLPIDSTETNDYILKLKNLLKDIDDNIILEQKYLNIFRKFYLLKLKYQQRNAIDNIVEIKTANNAFYLINNNIVNSLGQHSLAIELIDIKEEELVIEGYFLSLFNEKLNLFAHFGDSKIKAERVNRFYNNINTLGKSITKAFGFKYTFPLNEVIDKSEISFYAEIENSRVNINAIPTSKCYLSNENNSFYSKNHHSVTYLKNKGKLLIEKISTKDVLKHEQNLYKKLYKINKIGSRKAILARTNYFFKKSLKKEPIWLFMDRVNKADDNAEVLFEYAVSQKDGIEKYFIINESSKDYERLKKIGNVIPYGSKKHKQLMLLADKVISSHADEIVLNPFGKMKKYYKDLLDYDFIFLQHGIIKDDLSSWLNRFNKNIKLFITSSEKEYKSIIEGNYNYTEGDLLLSGLPRFDKLINESKKRILVMPTWRSDLVKPLDTKIGEREYNPEFKNSAYFNAINNLLNNPKLLRAVENKGYTIVFYPHPNIVQQLKDFNLNNSIEVANLDSSYRENFNQSDILITDYSSVAFDFAYLKKPIIYYQFDNPFHENFEKGYFDFETMGFGDVINEEEAIVEKIMGYFNTNCKMENKYMERVDSFFEYNDKNNCKRVYEALIKLQATKS